MDNFKRLWGWCREPKKPTPLVGVPDEKLRMGENMMRHTPPFFIRVFAFALGWFLISSYLVYLQSYENCILNTQWVESLSFESVALHLVGGVLIGLVLGWALTRTRLVWYECVIIAYLILFVIHIFNNVLEGTYFSILRGFPRIFPPFRLEDALWGVGGFWAYLGFPLALIAGVLFAAKKSCLGMSCVVCGVSCRRLGSEVSAYFKERARVSWLWRIAVASAAYLPIYIAFWALIGPFVAPYYLSSPWLSITAGFTLLVPLELLRGLLYVFALLPILATMRGRLSTLYFGVVSLLYVPGALVPLMIYPWTHPVLYLRFILPSEILPIHAVEILGKSAVHGAVITLLLARKPK